MPPKNLANDHNVYIVGAGFSHDAGLPLIPDFLERMRDAAVWIESEKRNTEAAAIAKVMDLRRRATAAGYYVELNAENIEELFSLASASESGALNEDVVLAIAATLDYAWSTSPRQHVEIRLDGGAKRLSEAWTATPDDKTGQYYRISPYDAYLGLLAGTFGTRGSEARDTIISFNYDLQIEAALSRLGVPFSYGFAKQSVKHDESAKWIQNQPADGAIGLYKLHGSMNWAYPGGPGGKLTVYDSYADVRKAKVPPLLVPPTWNKIFAKQLAAIWDASVAALRTATRIVVIGFSIPPTDVHFKYLMAAGLQESISLRKLLFVNPDKTDELRARVRALFRNNWLVSDDAFLKVGSKEFFVSEDNLKSINRGDMSRIRVERALF